MLISIKETLLTYSECGKITTMQNCALKHKTRSHKINLKSVHNSTNNFLTDYCKDYGHMGTRTTASFNKLTESHLDEHELGDRHCIG